MGIFPENCSELVDGVLARLADAGDPNKIVQLQVLKEQHRANTIVKDWENHEKLPACSLRTLFTRFLDITTPPSRQLLTLLATFCSVKAEEERLQKLATDSTAYEDWRYSRLPHLLEVLQEFPSCKVPATILIVNLMPLQPRFYSISSCVKAHQDEVHLTVAIVRYRSEDGKGAQHYGVCSNYLNNLKETATLYCFIRSAANFHLPAEDKQAPVLLVGPGTGIAPFRSFWQHWAVQKEAGQKVPVVWLYFGCRTNGMDLYRDEKQSMCDQQVLDKCYLALSREQDVPKTYVQDLIAKQEADIYRMVVQERGHVFVCGDVTMADNVYQTLR